jgi:hypothetical protein
MTLLYHDILSRYNDNIIISVLLDRHDDKITVFYHDTYQAVMHARYYDQINDNVIIWAWLGHRDDDITFAIMKLVTHNVVENVIMAAISW